MKLIDYSTANKTSYWTINRPISVCSECFHVVNGPAEVCPVCGSHNMDWWIRIIGYLRPLSAYSKERFKEAKKRVFHKKDEEDIV
jgi:ribonucleoside-triphosphate reductase